MCVVARHSSGTWSCIWFTHSQLVWQSKWNQYLHISSAETEDQTHWDTHALHLKLGAWSGDSLAVFPICRANCWHFHQVLHIEDIHLYDIPSYTGVTPKSYHHHVIRPLTYIFPLNPSIWSGNPCCLSILHKNTLHRAFPINHEQYPTRTALSPLTMSSTLLAPPVSCLP